MNNKQKVLKILDKHRDMSLTMGCELVKDHSGYTVVNDNSFDGKIGLLDESKNTYFEVDREVKGFIRIGHPATPLTLLKALGGNGDGKFWYLTDGGVLGHEEDFRDDITIPLTTTLTELPHTHQLWTDLLPILS